MAPKVMTSIYLTPTQKRAIAKRAKAAQTTVSEEIRIALDKHLRSDNEEAERELSLLAHEANRALDRMIEKLDESHTAVTEVFKTRNKKKL